MSAIQDIATIGHLLQHLKEKIPTTKWNETPLPIVAAPRSWLREVAEALGARAEDGGEMEPESIHGCGVICRENLLRPVLIDHDGKAYPIQFDLPTQPTQDGPATTQ